MKYRIGLQCSALKSFVGRYVSIWRAAWEARERDEAPWLHDESEFLPAVLELQRTPVSPLPRVTMATIAGLIALAMLWATFGKLDVVATAQGKIIAGGHSKVVQSVETAKVVAIHVTDGQSVQKGEVLIKLDSSLSTADRLRMRDDLISGALDVNRGRTLLAAIDTGLMPTRDSFHSSSAAALADLSVSSSRIDDAWQFLNGEFDEYVARVRRLDAEASRSDKELGTIDASIRRLTRTLDIARAREMDFEALASKHFVSRHELLDRQQSRIEQEGELAMQRGRMAEVRASLVSVRRQRDELVASTRRTTLDMLHEATLKANALRQEYAKAEARDQLMTLTAPVDGTVQQLAIHTQGGVVTASQPLMMIVPDNQSIEIEAFLENKDIGFVKVGQMAAVKVETFLFTRYGTLPAEVISVSRDAIQDEKRGLIYSVRLKLTRSVITHGDRRLPLSPGMAVSVEVRTDKRRVIEYFLSPLMTRIDESFHER